MNAKERTDLSGRKRMECMIQFAVELQVITFSAFVLRFYAPHCYAILMHYS
jgi:hypothetical protein